MSRLDRLGMLVELAQERSSDRRRELLRAITDIFLDQPETHSAEASAGFGAIMEQIAYDLEAEIRAELAEILCSQAAAPRDLIRRLAGDEIAVAEPVLKSSPVLTQADLVGIADQHSQDHLHAITHRGDIGEHLSQKLVERGETRVVEALLRNESATINRKTMESIVDRAQRSVNSMLDAPLVDRADLPPDLLQDLFWSVSKDLRERILKQTSEIEESRIDQALAEIEARFGTRSDFRQQVSRNLSRAEELVAMLAKNKMLNEAKLVELARAQKIPELICAFARLTELDLATAKRILFDRTGESLTIACRANGFGRNTYSAFLMSIDPGTPRSIEETRRLMSIYARIDDATAQRIMRFWRVRKGVLDRDKTVAA